jgi:hypothetical protein
MRRADITEARDLEWYFSVGVSAFERSPTGPMLDRAALLAVPRPPTPRHANGQFTGEVEPITAQPIRETRPPAGVEPDERTLARFGDLSRRMRRLRERDPLSARALELGFGDRGASWSSHQLGRVVALFPLVPSGQALIRKSRVSARDDFGLGDADRLRVEVELDSIQPGRNPTRHGLIASAALEACEVLAEALRAWRAVR